MSGEPGVELPIVHPVWFGFEIELTHVNSASSLKITLHLIPTLEALFT